MLWVKTPTLKKFFFFKDGDLYKIAYAYGIQAWPGLTYQQILDDKFKIWFGISPSTSPRSTPRPRSSSSTTSSGTPPTAIGCGPST